MTNINNFEDLILHLSQRGTRKRVAVVWAEDESTQKAVTKALEKGFVDVTFVGCVEQLQQLAELKPYQDHISYVDVNDRDEAAVVGFIQWLAAYADREKIEFVISMSSDREKCPEAIKPYLI